MDDEIRNFIEYTTNELEKQKKFNEGVLKCIESLREQQERILEIMAGK
ncbi:hypothetical protein KAU33_04220 [Candidatus Dependentiae bacterium]|nr:hypothetical protein [Candidatus Dependentiae bacterium]